MTVGELEHRMTAAEFTHWAAYYNIKNMRQEVANKRMAGGGKRGR